MKPYKENRIEPNKMIRHFKPNIDSSEFVWHRDRKNRKIKILKNEGWLFQRDNELPIIMKEDFIIEKEEYHRIIKGYGELIVEIEEF